MLRCLLALVAAALLFQGPIYIPYEETRDLPAKAGSDLQISAKDWPIWVGKREVRV